MGSTYTISEAQQATWTQTGNTVNQSMAAGGATVGLASFVYTVVVPNNAVSAVEQLIFGNFRDNPPECPTPIRTTNADGRPIVIITVQDLDTGLASVEVTDALNATVEVSGFVIGTKDVVTVTGTVIDHTNNFGLTFRAEDLAGNVIFCDPVLAPLDRAGGQPVTQTFTGLLEDEGT